MPPPALGEGGREELAKRVREVLIGGYTTRAALAELAEKVPGHRGPSACVAGAGRGAGLPDVAGACRRAGRLVGETDPERLTRAFTALAEADITARENFTCCRMLRRV
ncbi:DUF6891 domain-containing protein [Kitasatospora gansuensis]